MLQRLSRNTFILLISNIGSAVLSFLLAVIIGRYYGEQGLGIYAGVLAWIFPLSFFVEFGFGTLMTRDIAQQPELATDYLRLTWQYRILVGGLLITLVGLFAPILVDYPTGMIIASPMLVIVPAYSAYAAIFRAEQRMLPIGLLNIGMLLAQVAFTILAGSWEADIRWLFIINTLTSLGQLFSAHLIYRRYFYRPAKNDTQLRLMTLLRQARPFAFAGIIVAVQARVGILWLEQFSTPIAVGLFVAAQRFIDGARMIPNAVYGALYPVLAATAHDPAARLRWFRRMMLGLGSYSVLVALILQLLAEPLLLLFGNRFVAGTGTLAFMGVIFVPYVLRSSWTLDWYARGREQAVNRLLIINLVLLLLMAVGWAVTNPITDIQAGLTAITHVMLYTELITVGLLVISEVILWRNTKPASSP